MSLQLTPDQKLARVLAKQRGIVLYAQLLECGLTPNAIARRVARGSLVRIDSGVYRSPQSPICWDQEALAGCLVNGPDAALYGLAAARVWRLDVRRSNVVEVIVPHAQWARSYGGRVVVHRSRSYSARDRVRCGEHYVTTKPRTILDLASKLTPAAFAQVVDDAIVRGLVTRGDLIALANGGGNGGPQGTRRALKTALRPWLGETQLESVPEARFLRLLLAAGIDMPVCQYKIVVEGKIVARVDFAWPHLRVALEVDGFRYHGTPKAHAHDSRRDNILRSDRWLNELVTMT